MRPVVVVAGFVACLALVAPASAAAPNYILIHGAGLPKPVLLANWAENGQLLATLVGARRATPAVVRQLRNRPRFGMALFWGWGSRPRPSSPVHANERGWFYPAHGSQPPVIKLLVNGVDPPRVVPPRVLRILTRHGIPVRR